MSLTQRAAALGFPTLVDAGLAVDPAAARLLPTEATGLGVSVAGGILEVVVDHIPTAAEISAYERASGCEVSITVADPAQFAALTSRATRHVAGRGIAELLTGIADSVHTLRLHVGQPPLAATATTVQPLPWPALSVEDVQTATEFLLDDRDDAVITWAGRQWKAAASQANQNPALTLVRTTTTPHKLSQLGLPADVPRIAGLPDGLVVLASPRGHGRTQTLTALVERIVATRPVTVLHAGATPKPVVQHTGTVIKLALGIDAADVTEVVEIATRTHADVVAIDAEAYTHGDLSAVLSLALSGVLVLVAVPAADATKALAALTADVPDFARTGIFVQLATAYRCALAQRLVPAADGAQIPAAGLWWTTPGLAAALASGDLHRVASAAQTGPGREHNTSLAAAIRALAATGRISTETAAAYTGALPEIATGHADVPAGWDPQQPDVEAPATAHLTTPAATPSAAPAPGGKRRREEPPPAPVVAPNVAARLNERIET